MNKRLLPILALAASVAAGAAADSGQSRIVIAIDLSTSTPLVEDSSYARRAGETVAAMLADLEPGDQVSLRTLGDYGAVANSLVLDWTVSRREPAIKVRRTARRIVARLPALIEAGKLKLAKQTDITGFLELTGYSVDCRAGNTGFVLLSDGVEWSARVNGRALSQGKAALPTPPEGLLTGCRLTIAGIGQLAKGGSAAVTHNLIAAWQDWADKAGMDFTPRPGI